MSSLFQCLYEKNNLIIRFHLYVYSCNPFTETISNDTSFERKSYEKKYTELLPDFLNLIFNRVPRGSHEYCNYYICIYIFIQNMRNHSM